MAIDILLIEDESPHSELVKRAFESRGKNFNLMIVTTIAAARQQIASHPPALVLADWLLPDGESLQFIKDDSITSNIPVVLLTSHGNEQVAVDAIKAGVLDYIVKSDQTLAEMPHITERALREWENLTQRKHAELELHQRVSELEAVNRISTLLRSTETLESMLPQLVDETLKLLGYADAAIWLVQEDHEQLEQMIARGKFQASDGNDINSAEGVIGYAFNRAQPYRCDFYNDPLVDKELRECFSPGWIGIFIPIRTAKQAVGVFSIAAPPSKALDASQVNILSTLCEIAGNAIHRMRLFEQTKRSLNRMAALRAIDLAISASVDFHPTLEIILNQALIQLEADAAAILKLDRYTNQLEVVSWQGFHHSPNTQILMNLSDGYSGQAILERRLINISDLSLTKEVAHSQTLTTGDQFNAYHAIPLIAKGQIKGVFEIFHRKPFYPDKEWLEFLEALGSQAAISIDNIELFESLQRSNQELRLSYDATIEGWSYALDLRDHETEGHTRRVVETTMLLARRVGIDEEELIHIRRGALLHDIGKMGIPDYILLKPEALTEDEWKIMRLHPVYAHQMLSSVNYLRKAMEIPYCHHEYWNGNGYPRGLKEDQIPLKARIFALADVWDALKSDRPYRDAWPESKIIKYIRKMTGVQFDPALVNEFINSLDSISAVT